jgi:hypothetical protein
VKAAFGGSSGRDSTQLRDERLGGLRVEAGSREHPGLEAAHGVCSREEIPAHLSNLGRRIPQVRWRILSASLAFCSSSQRD